MKPQPLRYTEEYRETADCPGQLLPPKVKRKVRGTPTNCRRLLKRPTPGVAAPDMLPSAPEVRAWVRKLLKKYQRRGIRWAFNRAAVNLWMPPGSGKTLTASYLALAWTATDKAPIVVVTNASVRDQFARAVRQFTYVEPLVLEGQTPYDVGDQRMVIVAWETLPHWRQELCAYLGKRGVVIFDEIHRAKSRVRFVKEYDPAARTNVYKSINNWSSAAAAVGSFAARRVCLTATPFRNNLDDLWSQLDILEPWCWGSSWDFVHRYCLHVDTPIWMHDGTERRAEDLAVGDVVWGWVKGKTTKRPKNRLVPATVERTEVQYAPVVKVKMSSGRELIQTPDHKWLLFHAGGYGLITRRGRIIPRVAMYPDYSWRPRTPKEQWYAGWLAGMYDGEGSRGYIAQSSEINPTTWAMLGEALTALDIKHTLVRDTSASAGGAYLLDGRKGMLDFFVKTRPVRMFPQHSFVLEGTKFMDPSDRVVSIEPWGVAPVVTISTSTGNYVANGYLSKNCDAKPGAHGGLDTSGRSNTAELNQRLKEVCYVVTREEATAELPPMRREVVYIKPEDQVAPDGIRAELKRAAKSGANAILEVKLTEACARKRAWLVNKIIEALEAKQKVVVLTGRRRDVERLREAVAAKAAKLDAVVWAGYGSGDDEGGTITTGHTPEQRGAMARAYSVHPGPCVLIGTIDAFGESIDGLQTTDLGILAMIPYTDGKRVQAEGRWFGRLGQDRPVLILYPICEGTIEEHVADMLLTKLAVIDETVAELGVQRGAGEMATALAGEMSDAELHAALLAKL